MFRARTPVRVDAADPPPAAPSIAAAAAAVPPAATPVGAGPRRPGTPSRVADRLGTATPGRAIVGAAWKAVAVHRSRVGDSSA